MNQLSCKREQKGLIRSIRKINSPEGRFHSHRETNNSYLPLIGRVQLHLAMPKHFRMFHAVEGAFSNPPGGESWQG